MSQSARRLSESQATIKVLLLLELRDGESRNLAAIAAAIGVDKA